MTMEEIGFISAIFIMAFGAFAIAVFCI